MSYNSVMKPLDLTIGQTDNIKAANVQAVIHIRSLLAKVPNSILLHIVGGLSNPSKMPGYAYSIPAEHCKVGSTLRAVKGSACSKCYALKGNYVRFPKVYESMQRRFQAIRGGSLWVAAMSLLLERKQRKGNDYFRWHDSGDIQDANHFRNICMVHKFASNVLGWIPTREYGIIDSFNETIPHNLIVRVSAHMIGKVAPSRFKVSSIIVPKGGDIPQGVASCPAPQQGGKCGDCRNCWNSNIPTVAYTQH